MGTTAQKLQRVLDTKEGLKDTINTYLGQDITSAIPFKDYETYIKNFYGSLPKTSYAEGSNITLSNTLKGKLDFEDGIVGYGDTKQYSTQGYNELNIYAVHSAGYTETVSGVTFKYNDDGSVSANGKATADINFFLGSRASLGDLFNGTYYLSGCTTGSNATYYLSMWADGIGVYPQTTTEVATNKTSGVNWNIVIAVKNGTTINYTFYPMMCATSGKTYEQYSGGYSSPSPNWEQDIEVVRGKNRFNENELEIGSIDVTTGQNLANTTEFRTIGYIEVSDVVTLSNYNYLGYTHRGIFEYDSNKNYIKRTNDQVISKTTPFTLNLASNTRYIRIRYTVGSTITTIPTNMQIQLEERKCSYFLSTL